MLARARACRGGQRPHRGRATCRRSMRGRRRPCAAWDWAYYSERVRKAALRHRRAAAPPYFELERVLRDGVFYAAGSLYGLRFAERHDLPRYHPDVRVFEVSTRTASPLGLFLADFYARASKRGGAWMNSFVDQSRAARHPPVVVNKLNIARPAGRRAHAAHPRRGPDACSTSSATPCTGCSPTVRYPGSPAPTCPATSSSTRRRSTRCGRCGPR